MHPDGTHVRPILGLSDFAPRFIDWGARTQHHGDEPGGDEDNGDRQDDESQSLSQRFRPVRRPSATRLSDTAAASQRTPLPHNAGASLPLPRAQAGAEDLTFETATLDDEQVPERGV